MTPEHQKSVIALALGWTYRKVPVEDDLGPIGGCYTFLWKRPKHVPGLRDEVEFDLVPSYPNSLDAMSEAEKVLTADTIIVDYGQECWGTPTGQEHATSQRNRYFQHLLKICGGGGFDVVHATAAQRSEAFLKTPSLWQP